MAKIVIIIDTHFLKETGDLIYTGMDPKSYTQGAKLDIPYVKTVLKLFRKEQKLFAFSYHNLFCWKLKCYLPSNHLRNLEICL